MSFTIGEDLLEHLGQLVTQKGYLNRSEFIRDMIRDLLVEREWQKDEEVVGTITLVYSHHTRGLTERLTHLQHCFEGTILANTHVHLDEHICVEAILVRGQASRIDELVDLLRRHKGVLKAGLTIASLGKTLR